MPIQMQQNPETHVALLVDSSGSMMGHSTNVVNAVNTLITDLKTKAAKLGQTIVFSLYSFGGTVDTLVQNRPIGEVGNIKQSDYVANGNTPLLDAMTLAIGHIEAIDHSRVANLITVITDGQENCSRVGPSGLKDRIRNLTKTDRYTFTAMVPKGDVAHTAQLLGLLSGNIVEWDTATDAGLKAATQQLGGSYGSYLASRAVGATKSANFFEAKIDPQQAVQVKKSLTNINGDFVQLPVTTQTPKVIKDFVEHYKLRFMKGRAFYQLTKPEKVQHHKEILLKEVKTGNIYGGSEARGILGLPQWQEVKVKPADFSDWQIFVQSTSDNRKLMDGTTLLWLR